jgi:hypothetical protein
MFSLDGELLHKLNQFSENKNYVVRIGSQQFKFTKTQIALLSPIAFKHFIHQSDRFLIEIPSNFNVNDLISCFEQLHSLFHSTTK